MSEIKLEITRKDLVYLRRGLFHLIANIKWQMTQPGVTADLAGDLTGAQDLQARLIQLTEELKADPFHCPDCGQRGQSRSGYAFEHELRCGSCNTHWDPRERTKA